MCGSSPAGVGGRVRGDVGDTAQDLGQDHAGVAPGAVAARRPTARGDQCDARRRTRLGVGLGQRRTHGEQHVRPGVGVGDRENVEPVDLVDVGDQVADGGVRPVPQGRGVQQTTRLTATHLLGDCTSSRRLRWRQPIHCGDSTVTRQRDC